ncbi:hypothetical protein os1_36040 [Comamonadaceae bacterium OS-1]|nr:hypothetical protein os1_36040 [Comamonadaceae bacterium OS-1]
MSLHTCFLCLRSIHLAKEKEPKERPPPLPAPRRLRVGEPAVLALGGVWLNSPAAQTTPALIRPKLCSSAHLEGDPGYGIGGAKRRVAPRARTSSRAPAVCRSDSTLLNTTPISRPRRDARLRRAVPAPRGPHLYAPRSAVAGGSGLALFERSEFSQTPHSTSTAGSRSASGGRRQLGRLSFGDFSFAQKKSYCAAGRNSRPTMHSDEPNR